MSDAHHHSHAAPTTSSSLDPLEALLRHRELHGYGLLDELKAIVKRAISAPSANRCMVVLGGPDALFVPTVDAALEFLMTSLGFIVETDPGVGTHLQLPLEYEEGTADWKMFQKRGHTALEALEWASTYNSSRISLKLHSLVMLDKPLSAAFRLQTSVEWEDELGHAKTQLFDAPNFHNEVPIKHVNEAGVTEYRYSEFVDELDSQCDVGCRITVSVLRKRMLSDKLKGHCQCIFDNTCLLKLPLILHDPQGSGKSIGQLSLEVSSLALKFAAIESRSSITSPTAGPGLHSDGVTTTRHEGRGVGATATTTNGVVVVAAGGDGDADQKDGDFTNLPPPVSPGEEGEEAFPSEGGNREWVEEVQKAPKDDGVKYDADDYF